MDSTELAEHLQENDADTPYYETLVLDFGTDRPAWWACNIDGREIDLDDGCPDHAPRKVPGLYLVECETDPSHGPVWVRDGEHTGYGVPCWRCMYHEVSARLAKAEKRDRCYHWPWRRWRVTTRVFRWLTSSGICTSRWSWVHGGVGHNGCLDGWPSLRGKRHYILGVSREEWRCWLVGHHRRGEEVGFGFCGKCMPWPCCGAETEDHLPACPEQYDQTAVAA